MRGSGIPLADPISAAWNTVARFDDYASAQRAVDRLTTTRAATAGALSGLWAGLLFGILLGLFTSGHSFLAVAATGAAWGAVFGYVAHARTKGQRDFSSVSQLVATHYDLIARGGTVERARYMLGEAGLTPEPGPAPDTER